MIDCDDDYIYPGTEYGKAPNCKEAVRVCADDARGSCISEQEYLGVEEICNGEDDDCDGEIDEDVQGAWYMDADGDGYGDPSSMSNSCAIPGTGDRVGNANDCDDNNNTIYP